jgi:hypothetical protein
MKNTYRDPCVVADTSFFPAHISLPRPMGQSEVEEMFLLADSFFLAVSLEFLSANEAVLPNFTKDFNKAVAE